MAPTQQPYVGKHRKPEKVPVPSSMQVWAAYLVVVVAIVVAIAALLVIG